MKNSVEVRGGACTPISAKKAVRTGEKRKRLPPIRRRAEVINVKVAKAKPKTLASCNRAPVTRQSSAELSCPNWAAGMGLDERIDSQADIVGDLELRIAQLRDKNEELRWKLGVQDEC